MSDATPGARDQFIKALLALEPYLDRLILIGGWVPALYREFGGLAWRSRVSFTAELDILATAPLPVAAGRRLEDALTAAGFEPLTPGRPSAVWTVPTSGASIEFLTPLAGTERDRGTTQPLADHGNVGAIALSGLEVMAAFTTRLKVPAGVEGAARELEVRVPTLGAYVTNKAATFPQRRPHTDGTNPKRAKDLLYLRDVAAAGEAVEARIRENLAPIRREGHPRFVIGTAANNLRMAANGHLHPDSVIAAGAMLEERERFAAGAGAPEIRGRLMDLADLLEEFRT